MWAKVKTLVKTHPKLAAAVGAALVAGAGVYYPPAAVYVKLALAYLFGG